MFKVDKEDKSLKKKNLSESLIEKANQVLNSPYFNLDGKAINEALDEVKSKDEKGDTKSGSKSVKAVVKNQAGTSKGETKEESGSKSTAAAKQPVQVKRYSNKDDIPKVKSEKIKKYQNKKFYLFSYFLFFLLYCKFDNLRCGQNLSKFCPAFAFPVLFLPTAPAPVASTAQKAHIFKF